MANVASQSFFERKVVVVLRDGRFVHRRPEIRRIGQALGKCVVGQQTQFVRITATHLDIAGVVPTLSTVLQKVDGADRESLALYDRISAARRKSGVRHKSKRLERSARSQRARSRQRVVNQMRPLQMEAARAEVADFDRGISIDAL